ncbi:MAG: carboxypeptidase regulatory-like domain-containing protein, partial [Planctomycetes bacterium]|nr:carboxypeptidase regulatory-like domain-containing protein [Planctomycetota bacterium]
MKSKDQLALVLVVLGLAAAGLWLVFSQSGSPSEERLESGGDSQASREGDDPESAGEGPREARVERPRHDQPVVEQSSTTEPASVVETPQPEEWQAALYGRVITKTGLQERPVAGAFVALCRDMADHKSMTLQGEVVQHTVTDEAGRYALEGIDTLTSYLVRVEHPEYASRFLPQVELRSKEARKLDILVQAGFTIEGSVTTQDGLPVVGAEVLVVDQTFRVLDQIEGVERRGYSDQNGAFSVANLTSGFKQVHARREGLSTASRSNVFVTSGASEPISLTMGEAASISGSVVGKDDGRPIAEVVVTAIPVATGPGAVSAYPSVATDASGRFDYGGL